MTVRRQIDVSGLVQGVGFRPFVYRLAADAGLSGFVRNNASGVAIEVQGSADSVENFLQRLHKEAPPLAQVVHIEVSDLGCIEETNFQIVESHKANVAHTLISPDIATCNDCIREMFDSYDRRFRFPFINCTNCGPRFTIVRNIPYDRPATSMAPFKMCYSCQTEYDDPRSRRFHAQPNACWECGPRLELYDSLGNLIQTRDPIGETIALLRSGQIVAVKGLGGFHLACDALNAESIRLLRQRKHRIEKPFAIMVPNPEAVQEFCHVSAEEHDTLESKERPIVLLRKSESCAIPDEVAPFHGELGVFLPYTPVHHLLLCEGGFKALVMTSGNMSEEPIAIDNHDALERLRGLADAFLVHNREILLRCDDSVVRVTQNQTCQLRRSRGFVPVPILLQEDVPAILAVGGELKNTICLTSGRHAFLSQHIGDLENLASYSFLEEAAVHLESVLEIRPEIIAYDLHPGYFSTRWALERQGSALVGVQHHHAHIASCMAENHLDGKVIGIACDGTGFGTDGCIWGGEALVADYRSFQRVAHLDYVPMPGGEAAIREPWRMALGYLWRYFGREFPQSNIPFLQNMSPKSISLVLQMMDRRVNSPLTSSCGRLFDAVAAIACIRQKVNYEGQAAIELEMAMDHSSNRDGYPFQVVPNGDGWVIGMREMFAALMHDISLNVSPGVISARFHKGVVDVWAEVAQLIRESAGINRVCLSGGSFNNVFLARHLTERLQAEGFAVFTHSQVPCGDGGLCLGQAVVAAHRR
jgi:hydrogenase maturation protein HypF